MFRRVVKWWRSRKEPKVWAVYHHGIWAKAVTYKKPYSWFSEYVVGPFRSEVDCEEYCDKRNSPYVTRYIKKDARS